VKITLADTNARAVTIPNGTRTVTVLFVAVAGTVAYTGTDGNAQTANAIPVAADTLTEIKWPAGGGTIYIAGASACTAHVHVENA
jgi:hypothetical protein